MAIVYADRVKVRSRSTGTGEFELENAVDGFQSFDVIGDGNQTYYGIVDAVGNWEIGLGTYEIDSTNRKLYRNTVISSSNSNLLVNFAVGSKNVYTTIPSSLVAPLTGSELDPVFTGSSLITADIKGSVFADDSTMLIDGTNVKINLDGTVKGDIIPDQDIAYDIGSATYKFRDIYLSGSTINLGAAQITATGSTINLPVGSTVGGQGISVGGASPAGSIVGDLTGSVFADDSTLLVDAVSGSIPYSVLSGAPTIPADVSDLTDTGNLLGGGGGDGVVEGSIYKINIAGDDSTLLVDSDNGKIVGYVENDRFTVDGNDYQVRIGVGAGAISQSNDAIAIGEGAGNYQQGTRSVAIGRGSGNADQGISAVGIGFCAGGAEQGDYAIAIGFKAGRGPMAGDPDPAQPNNSIIINASGDKLNGTNSGLYIDPVREDTGNTAKSVYYNTTTKELTYADPTGGSGESLVSDNNDITVEIDNAGTPGNTLTWTFGTDGNLTLPRGDIVSSDDISLIINSVDSTSYRWKFNQLGFVEIPNVNNQLGGTIGDTYGDGNISIKANEAAGSYAELTNGDQTAGIYVQGDSTTTGANDVQVAIYTNNSGGMEFTGDGNAVLLGDEFRLGRIKSVSGIDERTTGSFSAGVLTINNNQRNGDVRNVNTSGGFPFPPLFTANFTVNLTGFTLQQDHFTTVRVEIEQHSSAGYYPSVLQIDDVAQTINWEGGVNPAPIGGTRDLAVFYIRNTSATIIPAYSVIGHYIGGNQTRFDGDVTGSVFADNSTLLVDGVNGKIVGDVETARLRTTDPNIALGIAAGETNQGVNTIAIGAAAGQANQGTSSIAIGGQAGNTAQGVSAVALGAQAGSTNQGAIAVSLGTQAGSTNQGLGAVAVGTQAGIVSQGNYAVALGYLAGANNQPANSIVINASGSGLDGSAAGFYVNPVRNLSGTGRILQYDTTTKEVSYTNGLVGDLTGSIFADDSTLLVDGVSGKIVGDVAVAEEWKVTVGPDFYTFNYLEGFGSTLEIPGGIRGKLQTALLTGNDIGVSIDGENTPNNVSIGDIANGNTLRIESGSSAGDIILTSSGGMDVRSEGAVTIDINLTDSTTHTWRFGEDGDLAFPDATVQTTAWAGIPGPYADDAAAATAGVAVGYPYHKTGTSGQVFVRLA